jgi:hypothetical protein
MHEFLLPHSMAFYIDLLGLSDDHDRLTAVAGYILAHDKLKSITSREVQRGDRSMRKLARQDTDKIFEQLSALGWITPTFPTGKHLVRWVVNPEVHRVFAGKAKEEAERRERDKALIIDRKTRWKANAE